MQIVLLACLAAALVIVPAVNAQDYPTDYWVPCSADRLTLYMPDDAKYIYLEELGYCADTKADGYITMWIKSDHDVTIALTSSYGTWETQILLEYLVWGLWSGNVCHAAVEGFDSVSDTCFVDGDEWRQIWISWNDGRIKVGKGGEVNKNTVLDNPKEQEVNYIGVYTDWGAHGQFAFGYDPTDVSCGDAAGLRSVVYEEEVYTYRYLEDFGLCYGGETGGFSFWIRSANDAHISLSDSNDQDDTIALNLGVDSNSAATIFNHGSKKVNTKGTWLDESTWKSYWISWTQTQIALGTGLNIGENQIGTTSKDATQKINYVGICSDWWNRGSWAFGYDSDPTEEQEPTFTVNTADVTKGHSADGALCHNDIQELQDCIDYCVDQGVDSGCYGIDWNFTDNPWNNCRCWIFSSPPGALHENANIDHYMPHS